ncbi:MAG TPA: hypothetical protein VF719_07490, partial [Abditibacteriaceae bacterium]
RSYAAFCAQAARAVNARGVGPVRYFELPTAATSTNDASAIAFYNRGRASIKAISSTYRVGGIGAASGRTATLTALLSRAQGLDFLSLQHYGATAGEPVGEALFRRAADLAPLRGVATVLDRSRFRSAAIFLHSNLNSTRAEGGSLPADARTVQMISSAWWVGFVGNQARLADQIFHNDAANPEWGLLDENARAYPAYYALWMWNTFFPVGSERVQATASHSSVTVVAVNTPTAHNVLLANTTSADLPVRVGIRGFPVLRAARLRIFEDPQQGVRFEDLPKSPFQNLVLKPYAVAVLQFIEPPKTAKKR